MEHLPVPSAALRRIRMILDDPGASAADVSDVLRTDATLCGKVLRLANSASIGIPRAISSLSNAVVLLGVKRIYSVVLTSELIAPFREISDLPFSMDRFRLHSVIVAAIAESIARHIRRYEAVDENELFSGALLHDIGKLLEGVVDPQAMEDMHKRAVQLSMPFYRVESDDFSHTVLGETVAQRWGFPEELRACIAGHHSVARSLELHRTVSVIHIADVMAHLLGYALYPDETTPPIEEAALAAIRIPVERLRVIAEDILQQQDTIAALLEIIDGPQS